MKKLSFGRYDIAACMTFCVYAMCSLIIPMCLLPLAADLHFPLDGGGMGLGGALQLGRAIPMIAAMILCGFAAGRWGKRRSLGFSILFMSVGIMTCAFAPSYGILIVALVISGLGEGVIEGLATPFVQDLHPDDSGRYLNISHSFWSVGVVAMVLIAGALLSAGVPWRILVFGCGLASVLPVLLFVLPEKKTIAQKSEEKVSWREICSKTRAIMKEKRFWLFFAAMFFAGGGEFCLTFWCAAFIQMEYGASAWVAGAGTACFAAGMFIGRFFSGFLVPQHRLKALIIWTSLSGTAVCLFFPWLRSVEALLVLLFVSGLAVAPFWPSIQSNGAERVKGDYMMQMILYSCAGVPGCGFFTMVLGVLGDKVGLRTSFYVIPACFLIVFVLMAYDWASERKENQSCRIP